MDARWWCLLIVHNFSMVMIWSRIHNLTERIICSQKVDVGSIASTATSQDSSWQMSRFRLVTIPNAMDHPGSDNCILGCPRKLGSMVSKWVIAPRNTPFTSRCYNPLIRSPLIRSLPSRDIQVGRTPCIVMWMLRLGTRLGAIHVDNLKKGTRFAFHHRMSQEIFFWPFLIGEKERWVNPRIRWGFKKKIGR